MATAIATHESPPALPSPAERPDADVVIYDGHCGFCTAQVSKLLRWDRQGKLAYLSLHDPEVARRWPDVDHDRLMQEMLVIDPSGRRHWGPDAIRHLAGELRSLWWAKWIFRVPGVMFVWRRMYRWIARNRYRISARLNKHECDDGTCSLHAR